MRLHGFDDEVDRDDAAFAEEYLDYLRQSPDGLPYEVWLAAKQQKEVL